MYEEENKNGSDIEKTILKSHFELRQVLNRIDSFILEKK